VPLLASLVGQRVTRYADLDSTFVNLPAMAKRLGGQTFSGFLFLRRNAALGVVVLDEGKLPMRMTDYGVFAPTEREEVPFPHCFGAVQRHVVNAAPVIARSPHQ
jgi:hypothetical protein